MTADPSRILLSAPDMGPQERNALLRAFDGGWIAPVGPELAAFERDLCDYTGAEACVALSSGTAGLHLGLILAGLKPGDEVIVQSATFAASAFAVIHAGGKPTFIDSDISTWCMDPELLESELEARARIDRLPRAVMPVDLYGSVASYKRIEAVCAEYGVAVVEDAAEALGSRSAGRAAGTFGTNATISFNGNKIMTTSGGGALLGPAEDIERARFLASQAREATSHYEHLEVGFNFRMSNLLAALGSSQLSRLEQGIRSRTLTNERYRASLPDLTWCPMSETDRPNHWLSVAVLPDGVSPSEVCMALEQDNIEARPFWKPMHLQPVFDETPMIGGAVSEELFRRAICLPSGSSLTDADLDRVVDSLSSFLESTP